MKKTISTIVAILLLAPAAFAQVRPTITQSQLECVSPNAFIKVNTNVGVPAGEAIDYVRVYFRSPRADGDTWYFVAADRASQFWTSLLPAPMPGVTQISYRSEVVLKDGTSAMTDIMTVNVSEDCPEVAMDRNPCVEGGIIVGTTAPEPELPEGFNNAGIDGVVTEEGTMVAAGTITGYNEHAIVCPGAFPVAGAPGGSIMGIPTAGAVVGGVVAAGILGAIIDNQSEGDSDRSPN